MFCSLTERDHLLMITFLRDIFVSIFTAHMVSNLRYSVDAIIAI